MDGDGNYPLGYGTSFSTLLTNVQFNEHYYGASGSYEASGSHMVGVTHPTQKMWPRQAIKRATTIQ